jgi:hypothetical protein
MASVAVEYQKSILPLRTGRSRRNKELFKPPKTNFIRSPSVRTNLEAPIVREAIEPRFDKDFALKNHARRKRPPRRVYTLNCSHPRAVSGL